MRKYMNLFESKYLMEKENCKEIDELYEDITPKKIKRKPRKVSYR